MIFNHTTQGHIGTMRGQNEVSLSLSVAALGFQGLGTLYRVTTGGRKYRGGTARDTPL